MSARLRAQLSLSIALALALALAVTGCAGSQPRPASNTKSSAVKIAKDLPKDGSSSPTDSAHEPWASPEFQLVPATVTRVVDGDTAEMRLGDPARVERVRFIGVDTPESTIEHDPYGEEASAFTKAQLTGKKVWLQVGTEQRDRYGRLLAYVWMEPPLGASESEVRAKQFNADLLIHGYAQLLTIPPNTDYVLMYRAFQAEARDESRGLWGLTTADLMKIAPTSDDGAAGEGTPEYVGNNNSMKFHLATCKYVGEMKEHHKVPFTTREAVLEAGYIPCKGCAP